MSTNRMRLAVFAIVAAALVVCALAPTAAADEGELGFAPNVLDCEPGKPIDVKLPEDGPRMQGLRIRVPEGRRTQSIHVRTYDASADIDLWLCSRRVRNIDGMVENCLKEAVTGRLNEPLDFAPQGGVPAGTYFLYAGSLTAEADEEITFRLIVTFNEPAPPAPLPRLPFKPLAELKPLERAVLSCVLVDTDDGNGAGTVVTPTGLILTNRHVIEDYDGELLTEIYISFARDARSLPVQTHLATIVAHDQRLDLALLRVTSDIHGRKLEPPFEFTWLEMAQETPEFGAELRCLGYPAIGSTRSLGSVTLTRGVVSGFVTRRDELLWIKTDCLISVGNSGGTAIDENHRLVGVPTETMHDPDTMESLGYVRPVSALPASWMELIRAELPGGADIKESD